MSSKERSGGLGSAASRGAIVTMVGQGGRILIQFVGVVVLSRLLDPADFGLVAMVLAIVGVGEVFRDFGLTQAAVQSKTLSDQQRSNLFWLNTALGALLCVAIFACSYPIAALYGEPRLIGLAQALAFVFLLNGISTQYRAQLSRELRFLSLAVVEVAAQAFGLVLAIGVALFSGSYWALAAQQLAGAAISVVLLVAVTKWVPRLYRRGHQMGQFVRFGGFLVAAQFVTYLSKNVDSIVIGARLGPTDLGFYNRAFQILVLPLNQINAPATRVALPVLSRLQDERARFERFLLSGQTILLHLVMFIFGYAAALADPLINLVLGPGWGQSVPIFQILAISGAFQAASYATYWVFLSTGKTKSQLYWSLASRPLVIAAVLVGSIWGYVGVAWGYSLATAIVWPLGLLWISKACGAPSLKMFWNGLRGIIGYSVASVATLLVANSLFAAWPPIVAALVGLPLFVAFLALIWLIWPGFRRDARMLEGFARSALRKRSRGESGE